MDILKLLRKKSLPVPGTTTLFVTGVSNTANRTIKAYAEEGYSENPIVNACINMIAQACASVKLEIHATDDKGKTTVVNKHPMLDLLARPNPTQSWKDFIMEMVCWHRVAGEAFVLRIPETGTVRELWLLDPSSVSLDKDPRGSPLPRAYVYGYEPNAKRYQVNPVDGTSQVLHIKTFNPFDPFRGLPPMRAAARAIDTHNNGAKWNSALLENGARPSGVVEFEGGAPNETTLQQLREYFKKAWQGAVNAGNIPLLAGGAKFTALSHNPKDMDFKDSMAEAAKNIAMVFGVPLPLVTMEAATHSNTEQAEERLWIDTVLPLLDSLTASLAKFLSPVFKLKDNERLTYNADSVPALEARRERLYKRMGQAVKDTLITPDEGREQMGFEELGGNAEQLIVTGIATPLDKLGDQPAAPPPLAPVKANLLKLGYKEEDLHQIFGEAA